MLYLVESSIIYWYFASLSFYFLIFSFWSASLAISVDLLWTYFNYFWKESNCFYFSSRCCFKTRIWWSFSLTCSPFLTFSDSNILNLSWRLINSSRRDFLYFSRSFSNDSLIAVIRSNLRAKSPNFLSLKARDFSAWSNFLRRWVSCSYCFEGVS